MNGQTLDQDYEFSTIELLLLSEYVHGWCVLFNASLAAFNAKILEHCGVKPEDGCGESLNAVSSHSGGGLDWSSVNWSLVSCFMQNRLNNSFFNAKVCAYVTGHVHYCWSGV